MIKSLVEFLSPKKGTKIVLVDDQKDTARSLDLIAAQYEEASYFATQSEKQKKHHRIFLDDAIKKGINGATGEHGTYSFGYTDCGHTIEWDRVIEDNPQIDLSKYKKGKKKFFCHKVKP